MVVKCTLFVRSILLFFCCQVPCLHLVIATESYTRALAITQDYTSNKGSYIASQLSSQMCYCELKLSKRIWEYEPTMPFLAYISVKRVWSLYIFFQNYNTQTGTGKFIYNTSILGDKQLLLNQNRLFTQLCSQLNINNYICNIKFKSSSSHIMIHQCSSSTLSQHFCFCRLPRLKLFTQINLTLTAICIFSKTFLWSHFVKIFVSDNVCTFHFLCPCHRERKGGLGG